MANFAPGHSWVTACASTCAVEWRSTCLPSSVPAVMIATEAPSTSGTLRSTSAPFTFAATASAASFFPMEAARSAVVVPFSTSRVEPSGSEIVIWSGICKDYESRPLPKNRLLTSDPVPLQGCEVGQTHGAQSFVDEVLGGAGAHAV